MKSFFIRSVGSTRFYLNTLLFLIFWPLCASQAQSGSNARTIKVKDINFVYQEGKVYLNWVSKSDEQDGVYLIERSADGRNFTSVGVKECIGSRLDLLYSWVDDEPVKGTAYYRLAKINNEGSEMVSTVSQLNTLDELNYSNTVSVSIR